VSVHSINNSKINKKSSLGASEQPQALQTPNIAEGPSQVAILIDE